MEKTLLTRCDDACVPAAIFWLAGTLQMMAWAKKKHRNYKKEFGNKYPKDRWAMIPGIL